MSTGVTRRSGPTASLRHRTRTRVPGAVAATAATSAVLPRPHDHASSPITLEPRADAISRLGERPEASEAHSADGWVLDHLLRADEGAGADPEEGAAARGATAPDHIPLWELWRRGLLSASGLLLVVLVAAAAYVWQSHQGDGSVGNGVPAKTTGPLNAATVTQPTTAQGSRASASGDSRRRAVVLSAESWIANNVPADAELTTDAQVAADLATHPLRITKAATLTRSGRPGFVLSTPQLRSAARPRSPLAMLLARSLPVAIFGSQSEAVQLRQFAGSGLPALQDARRRQDADRLQAGAELLQNRNIVLARGVRERIANGELDIRAETFLALIAAQTTVRVLAVTTNPSETLAGMPARSLVVALHRADVTPTVTIMRSDYRPSGVAALGGSATRVWWKLAANPVRPVD